MVKNRAEIEKLVYDVFDAMDPSGDNTNKYRSLYENMSDKEFEKHMKQFLSNDDENFILDVIDYEHSFDMDKCIAGAKVLDIPLMEYVYMPHLTMDKKRVIVSKEKCLVGVINVKRTQQFLHKKNGLAMSDDTKSSITGQVVGEDKDARDSDIEASLLVALGAKNIISELHGPRSDDHVMARQMKSSIATKGYVLLEDLENLPTNKTTLNTLNTYLLSMGIKSDIISDNYIVIPEINSELLQKGE